MQQQQITPATQFDTKEQLLGALSTYVPFSIEVFNRDIMQTVNMLVALHDRKPRELHNMESILRSSTSIYFFKCFGQNLAFALPSIAETVFLQEWKRLCAHEKTQQTVKEVFHVHH